MALIKCPECGKDVSDTCKQCIHCGYDLTNVKNSLPEKPLYEFYIFIFFKGRLGLPIISKVKRMFFTITNSDSILGGSRTILDSNISFGDLIHIKSYKEECVLFINHPDIKGEACFWVNSKERYGADKPKVYFLDVENRPFSQAIARVPVCLQDYVPGETAAPSKEIVIK